MTLTPQIWLASGGHRATLEEAKRAASKIKTYRSYARGGEASPANAVIYDWEVDDRSISLASDVAMFRYHADPVDKLVVDLMGILFNLPMTERFGALALGHGFYDDPEEERP